MPLLEGTRGTGGALSKRMRSPAVLALLVLSFGCSSPSTSTDQAPSPPAPPVDAGQPPTPGADAGAPSRPLALVYRGPASCSDGCSEAWAAMFEACQPGFDVAFVGPSETLHPTKAVLATAAVYVQPGGNANLNRVGNDPGDWTRITSELEPATIQDFVRGGGRYLGSCTGGYMAGRNPWAGPNVGFDMIEAQTAEYITSPGAVPTTPQDTVTRVVWADVWGQTPTNMYFQDGPYFTLDPNAAGVVALATFASNGTIAAVVARYGAGKVGVEGPHAEAPADWYSYNHVPGSPNYAPGCDLIAKTLAP